MDWEGLLRKIHSEHPHEAQLLGRCELAIEEAKEALQILASHGYQFYLESGPGPKMPEWPKKLYHVDQAPNGVLVYSEKEAEELGPGWFDTLAKAQYWDGLETQFNGRGGVPKSRRVPTVVPKELPRSHVDSEARKRLIAAFKALHRWEKPTGLQGSKQQNGLVAGGLADGGPDA